MRELAEQLSGGGVQGNSNCQRPLGKGRSVPGKCWRTAWSPGCASRRQKKEVK